MNPLKSILEGLRTTTAGLRVTIPYIWKKPVTTQYPHQRLELPERTRNRLYVNMDDCIGCDQCARACPVNCIDIETVKAVGDDTPGMTSQGKKKALWVTRFDIDIAKCCYCGLCVYPCPTECIWMTDVFEFAETERRDLIYNFVTLTPEEIEQKRETAAAAETKTTKPSAPVEPKVEAKQVPASVPAVGDEDKAAKLAEIQRKMAEAKARREGAGGEAPAAPTGPEDSGGPDTKLTDEQKAAKIAEIQRKMAEAKARREGGDSAGSTGASPQSEGAVSVDDKAAKIADLQRKMAEAKARREADNARATGAESGSEAESSSPESSIDDKSAKIAELQRKMAEAKARREAGEGGNPTTAANSTTPAEEQASPTMESGAANAPADLNDDDKAAKIAELKRKMAEAKARREAGEQSAGGAS